MPAIRILSGHVLSTLVDESKLFEAADLNGIGITELLVPGVVLQVPDRSISLQKEKVTRQVTAEIVKSLSGQTWTDLSLQELGDEQRVFEVADANASGITDDIIPGSVLTIPLPDISQKRVISYLKQRKPASSRAAVLPLPVEEGIDFWAIEFDFVVS